MIEYRFSALALETMKGSPESVIRCELRRAGIPVDSLVSVVLEGMLVQDYVQELGTVRYRWFSGCGCKRVGRRKGCKCVCHGEVKS